MFGSILYSTSSLCHLGETGTSPGSHTPGFGEAAEDLRGEIQSLAHSRTSPQVPAPAAGDEAPVWCVVHTSNSINLKLKENILLYKHIPAPVMLFILIQNTGEIKQVN